jgi:hypothetical protein
LRQFSVIVISQRLRGSRETGAGVELYSVVGAGVNLKKCRARDFEASR